VRNAFRDGDCWFNSGDVMSPQGMGHAAFVDRLGDTFRWKGENVATTEVEAVLQNLPGVAEATVYGVLVPHADGRAGMAALRFDGSVKPEDAQFLRQLRTHLPAYAVPVFLRVVHGLEATATFKTRKQQLREEGCDPGVVADPLYVLWPGEAAYGRLTPGRWQALTEGGVRL